MCCANKIGHLATGLIPLGLIAEEAKLLIDEGLFRSAENPRLREYQDNTARNGLPDAEHRDPEHVWGDEGPVNDQ
jgi:hypothetical protein